MEGGWVAFNVLVVRRGGERKEASSSFRTGKGELSVTGERRVQGEGYNLRAAIYPDRRSTLATTEPSGSSTACAHRYHQALRSRRTDSILHFTSIHSIISPSHSPSRHPPALQLLLLL